MSGRVPQPARSHVAPSQPVGAHAATARGGPSRQIVPDADGPAGSEPPRPESGSPYERLVDLGVRPATARALLSDHGTGRVIDALDAVDELGDGEVRRRAGWVVSAVREGWDLEHLLAERRAVEARYARWERERTERDDQAARWEAREAAAACWRGAISGALDDRQLATAVEQTTSPIAGLGRRSVPIVRAELLAWAVTVHRHAPDRPLADVLADELAGGGRPGRPATLTGELPPAPAARHVREDDLTARLERLFDRRPDLARPGSPARGPDRAVAEPALGEGVGHGR